MYRRLEIDDPEAARRLARAIFFDLARYNREDLRAGRDMTAVVEEGRLLYQSRVRDTLHGIFEEELEGFKQRDFNLPEPPEEARELRRTQLKVGATVFVVVALIVGMLWSTRTDGDDVEHVRIPSTSTLRAEPGDMLRFEVDHDVYFRADSLEDVPDGCSLELTLKKGDRVLGTSRCDLFHTGAATVIADGTNAEEGEDGLTHLEVFELHLACGFRVPEEGPVTLEAASNLATCVPRAGEATLHVYRSR